MPFAEEFRNRFTVTALQKSHQSYFQTIFIIQGTSMYCLNLYSIYLFVSLFIYLYLKNIPKINHRTQHDCALSHHSAVSLKKACYAIRLIKPFMSIDVLRSTYFSYAHSIISYGIIFWGNSSYSEDIFKIQKRIIRIIMNSSRNASCWQLFKDLNILPIRSQYIYIQYFYLLLKIKTNFF